MVTYLQPRLFFRTTLVGAIICLTTHLGLTSYVTSISVLVEISIYQQPWAFIKTVH